MQHFIGFVSSIFYTFHVHFEMISIKGAAHLVSLRQTRPLMPNHFEIRLLLILGSKKNADKLKKRNYGGKLKKINEKLSSQIDNRALYTTKKEPKQLVLNLSIQ